MDNPIVFFLLGAIVVVSVSNLVVAEMQHRAVCELRASIDRLVLFLEKKN